MKVGKIGDLNDCASCVDLPRAPRAADVEVVISQPRALKPRKPRSKGTGPFCVLSHKGRTVHCYENEATAKRVADSFTKRGRSGTKFHVEKRG